MAKLRALYEKHREIILYVFFGGLTTAVNALVYGGFYFLLLRALGDKNAALTANTVAWVTSVAFAYVTNKLFVFSRKSWAAKVLRRELPSFVGVRLLSFAIDQGLLFLFIDTWKSGILAWVEPQLHWPAERLSVWYDLCVKLPIMVIVLALNYIFSKFVIFKTTPPLRGTPPEEGNAGGME